MTTRATSRLIGIALLPLLTTTLPASEPALTIQLYNYAGAPASLLAAASKVGRTIFGRAGLQTTWIPCGPPPQQMHPSCAEPPRNSQLHVGVLDRTRAEKLGAVPQAVGVAFPDVERFGVSARVFYHRVRQLGRETGVDAALIFGHVLAHEAGHLLLGLKSHAPSGIMTADWRRAEMLQAQQGLFNFHRTQARRIREQVRARQAADQAASQEDSLRVRAR